MFKQALTPLLGAGLTVATCYAAGSMLLARLGAKLRRGEIFPLAFVIGAACVHLAVFAIFTLKIGFKPVLFSFEGAVLLAAYLDRRRRASAPAESFGFSWSDNLPALGYAALFAFFTALYFVNAWAPEISADGSGYHLAFVADYLRANGFYKITTSMYAGLGEGAELLYALAFALGRHSAAALVHFTFMLALALMMLAFGMRTGKWWVGAGAALLVYFSPVVGKDGSSAYIDMVAAAIVFSIFYWMEIWKESGDDRLLIAIGLLCGYAYATKYTAVFILVYVIGFIVWTRRSRSMIPILKICALAAVMILPWMIKDWIYLHDPVAPMGAKIFRNPNITVHELDYWVLYLRSYHLPSFRSWPLDATVFGNYLQGPLGPVFLLTPLALFALGDRLGLRLLLAGFVMLIPYPMNIGTRFLITALPFFALAMTIALRKFPRAVSALVLVHAILSWPTVMADYSTGWRIVHFPLQAALRRETEDGFLRRERDDYVMARLIDERVPPGERVLSLSGLPTSYIRREVLTSYESASSRVMADALWTGYNPGFQPVVGLTFKFPPRSVQRIRVLQTARAPYPNQWNVTEIRFLDHGRELPRSPDWRVRAWPNPWYVQLAFDNSAATCWHSGEGPAPGMWIETDFGAARSLDQVEIQEAPDTMWVVTLQIEAMDAGGKWIKIADNPTMHALPVPPNLRHQSTYELYRRGIHYLVARDDDFGGSEYLEDPEGWNLEIVGRTRDATLYRILP